MTCAVPPPSASCTDPTEEGEGREAKGEGTAQDTLLSALGIMRPLYDSRLCPYCQQQTNHEACYSCSTCQSLFHVSTHPSCGT